jgi:hypothetical protein
MSRLPGWSFAAVTTGLLMISTAAAAEEPDIGGQAASDAYELVGQKANQSEVSQNPAAPIEDQGAAAPAFTEYRWVVVCTRPTATSEAAMETDCNAARVCAEPNELLYRLWGRSEATDSWVPLSTRCFGSAPTDADTPEPGITPGLVLNEVRRIGLPTLETHTQPQDKTLVNFDTIFYTEPHPFSATVTLLGQQVDITAEPTSYTWHHGDGTDTTTRTPGAPYPAKDITHRYTRGDTTVRPRVDVTYTARFRVNGGAWQDIDETVTIAGPQTSLRITEATPVLSGDYS